MGRRKQPKLKSTVGIDGLSARIQAGLVFYKENVIEGIKTESKDSMKKLVKQTKATAPVGKRSKHYKSSITSKKQYETDNAIGYVWYVKGSDYRLSHLLEKGHLTRDGKRTKAYHFIENATNPILEEYQKKVEEIIRNG